MLTFHFVMTLIIWLMFQVIVCRKITTENVAKRSHDTDKKLQQPIQSPLFIINAIVKDEKLSFFFQKDPKF